MKKATIAIYAGYRFKQWHVVVGYGLTACERPTKGMIHTKRLGKNEKLCNLCQQVKEQNDMVRFKERVGLFE